MDKKIRKRKVKGKGGLTIGNSNKYGDYTRLSSSKSC
jgi:hypothetical protein